MNTRHRTQTLLVAAALLLASTAATARETPRAIYANELARCVQLVRGDLQDSSTRRLRHTVTQVQTRGVWHEFTIHSEAFDDVDGDAVRVRDSSCRAHRWTDATQIRN